LGLSFNYDCSNFIEHLYYVIRQEWTLQADGAIDVTIVEMYSSCRNIAKNDTFSYLTFDNEEINRDDLKGLRF
jgi:hypothetical protein